MKIIITTILATLAVVTLVAATASRITANQILGSQTPGQVLTTTAAGVANWSTPTTTTIPNFSDAEVPAGAINGTNTSFTLTKANGNTGNSLVLTRNGVVQSVNNDYTLTGNTVQFSTGSIPQTGDTIQCWYRY
jgi:hypothetical protein